MLDSHGHWWLVRVKPYLTNDGRIDGAIVVAVEIDLIKQTQALIEARDYALAVLATVREPLVVLDGQLRVGLANEAYYRLFGGTSARHAGPPVEETAESRGPTRTCNARCWRPVPTTTHSWTSRSLARCRRTACAPCA